MLNEPVSNPHDGSPDGNGPGFTPDPMPPLSEGGGGEIPRPKAIDNAFQASLAGTAIASVATVITVLLDREWLDRLVRQVIEDTGQAGMEVADARTMVQVSLGLGIVLFAALFVLFALKMRAGRNWARLLLTAFAAVGTINFLSAVGSTGADLELMWSLAEVAFAVTAVIYMFRPESTAYFTEHRKRRLSRRNRP
jgi:hypothetical protein